MTPLFVHLATMGDEQHVYFPGAIVDAIHNTPISYSISKKPGQRTREALDVVMTPRVALELGE